MKRKFKVTGMTCSACSAHVQKATEKVDGVKEAQVNLLDGSMVVECDENVTEIQPENRGVGLVFQSYALYPHLTVKQNITFPLENRRGADKLSHETGYSIHNAHHYTIPQFVK